GADQSVYAARLKTAADASDRLETAERDLDVLALQGDAVAGDHFGAPFLARPSAANRPAMPFGRNIVQTMKTMPRTPYQCSVNWLSSSLRTSNTATPSTGPSKVPLPPSSVMISTSPEVLQCSICGLT